MTEVLPKDEAGATMKSYDVGGYLQSQYGRPGAEIKAIFDHVPDFKCRPDDVLLVSFPKNGTTWSFEMVNMILKKSANRVTDDKLATMLDCHLPEEIEKQPSPRILSTHYLPKYLPKDLKTKQIKTILVVRNPKDTAVSYYSHMRGIVDYEYNGKWEHWIRPYCEGKFEYGSYSDYLNEWQECIDIGTGYPIYVMYYEDMKKDGLRELERLAEFLDVTIDDELKHEITRMCSFEKMRDDKDLGEILSNDFLQKGYSFFRKGQIGDWKNWFTVAQNEMFEDVWTKQIRKDTMFNFKYT